MLYCLIGCHRTIVISLLVLIPTRIILVILAIVLLLILILINLYRLHNTIYYQC